MHADLPPSSATDAKPSGPWWRLLNRYHWFVLVVAALGWLFDTMDQQLFTLARAPAMNELLAPAKGVDPDPDVVSSASGWVTCIFLLGWATGGLTFGVLGDRIGRAKTMLLTILLYSLCTGLSALSVGFWDFAFYRFITGLGVGGEFAVGVALVAEVMPAAARPFALGTLQSLSAVGNITAGFIGILLASYEDTGISGWRLMFIVGTLPALLAVLIRRHLKEPEQWKALSEDGARKQLGSYTELFSHPTWRRHAIVGMLLAFAGVVGLWGIGFFSADLSRLIFRKQYEAEARDKGETLWDRDLVRLAVASPEALKDVRLPSTNQFISPTPAAKGDPEAILKAVQELRKAEKDVNLASVMAWLDNPPAPLKAQSAEVRTRREAYLQPTEPVSGTVPELSEKIRTRAKEIGHRLSLWAGIILIMQNIGAFFGMGAFTYLTSYIGRRPAFAISFLAAMFSTAYVFASLNEPSHIFWMIPLMGFCQLALFGGYAIYFPELFPTHLRSTGTSFCYNVGRFVAASGPAALGLLTSQVFSVANGYPEGMRWAGVTMCSVFLLGILVLPFAPETKDKPLPEA